MSYVKRIGWFALLALVLLVAGSSAASAQCTVTRSQVEADVVAGLSADEMQAKYANCTASSGSAATATIAGPGISAISEEANTFVNFNINWERIESCGYHPQREEADCAIEIRQNTGFGGQICQAPGSTEYILLCVNFGAGLVPIHTGTVHVHDAIPGSVPPWDFGVVIQANPRLAAMANNGVTLQARAILSWAIPPPNCFWGPIWGNWANFRIRLDP